jgi:hypothetical protein
VRRHGGVLLFAGSALVALLALLVVVLPIQRSAQDLREATLDLELRDLRARLDLAPESDVGAVRRLKDRLTEALPEAGDRWARFSADGVRPPAAFFPEVFEAWLGAREDERLLAPGAWPPVPWRWNPDRPAPRSLPSRQEMESTVRLALFVRSLAGELRDRSGGRVTGVVLDEDPAVARLKVEYDPERVDGLVRALTRPELGGEPFDLLSLSTGVPPTGAARGELRVRFVDLKGRP